MQSENTAGNVVDIDIENEMKKSFIAYAMSVIINRALPDVRDGLKPVHRRILYSMHELGLYSDKPYRKCARIVGDVLGKYHPHGDSAVYESLVRLAQDFSTRYPLVQGHGNFGSVDGDGAAAMRYTEARLAKVSGEMLADLDKETVDFYPNFDETLTQPEVMPSRIPNLLVNGSGGIAVGMATNIPPHNLSEVVDACVELLENPDADFEQLMQHVKGPDFPTGGIIMGISGIREAYATGRGRITVRGRAEIEQFSANRARIIVTEIPYQVNKARLVEKIASLVHLKKIEGIADLRDESDRNGMRIVIELKKDVNANVVLNNLYTHTQMQDTFGVIMLALVNGEPRILSLKQAIAHYLEHREEVTVRRCRYELERARERAHILEGLLIALDNIDEVIHIIRSSKDDATARERLMERFGLSLKQSQAILDMRLRRLTGLEAEKLRLEHGELLKTIEYLTSVLSDAGLVRGIVKDELLKVKQDYGDERRTEILPVEGEVDVEDLINKEDMVVTLTHFGYIKRIAADTYRAQNRGGKGMMGLTTREEDFVENVLVSCTHTPLLFFTNKGRVYRLKCYEIPLAGRAAKGTAIVNILPLTDGEHITAAFPAAEDYGKFLVMATKQGVIKKTAAGEFGNIRMSGLIALGVREGDELTSVFITEGDDDIIVGTKKGMSIRFSEKDIRPMGRGATGVRSISLKDGDEVVDVRRADKKFVFTISENGYGKLTLLSEYSRQRRGGKGIRTMNVTRRTGRIAGLKVVDGDEDIVIIDLSGTIIRLSAKQVSVIGRLTQGVKLMRVEDTSVAAIAIVPPEEEAEENPEEADFAEGYETSENVDAARDDAEASADEDGDAADEDEDGEDAHDTGDEDE